MPLTMLNIGKEAVVRNCKTQDATGKFLEGLGIVPGAVISVLLDQGGNLIVRIKGTKLALNKGVAQHILVEAI